MADAIQVVCLGEAVIDFVPGRTGRIRDVSSFQKGVGGAPANTAIGLARQGIACALNTRLGDDEFGRYIQARLEAEGVVTDAVAFDADHPTGVLFIQVADDGARSFLPYRHGSAATRFSCADLDRERIAQAAVLHVCSNPMRFSPGLEAVLEAMSVARKANTLITADLNLRWILWDSKDACRHAANALMSRVDVVKANEAEARFVTGEDDMWLAARALHRMGPGLAVVTLGEAGCVWSGSPGEGECASPWVEVVDTTGAGDAFCAGMLSRLCHTAGLPVAAWPASVVNEAVEVGCRLGSQAATVWGATGPASLAD